MPEALYPWVGVVSVPVCPSPKSQAYALKMPSGSDDPLGSKVHELEVQAEVKAAEGVAFTAAGEAW